MTILYALLVVLVTMLVTTITSLFDLTIWLFTHQTNSISINSFFQYHGFFLCLTLTGLEGYICPSLVRDGKDIYVPLLWCHGGVIVTSFRVWCTWWWKKIYYIVVRGGGMSSWSMVNNEKNWLPWQIKDWFLVKFKVASPQRVNTWLHSHCPWHWSQVWEETV